LSQEELAELAGLHRTYISSLELGKRNVSLINIHALAKALGVSPDKLLKTE
jgi:transcriptional regulator with XRE-family HTH domain